MVPLVLMSITAIHAIASMAIMVPIAKTITNHAHPIHVSMEELAIIF